MFSVTKEIHFCYGHRLMNYAGKCRYFHGHNGKLEVQLSAEKLDDQGMVRDFTEIKQVLQTWVDQELDHRMILNAQDPLCATLETAGEPIVRMDTNPTAENIAVWIWAHLEGKLPGLHEVRLWEIDNASVIYRGPAGL